MGTLARPFSRFERRARVPVLPIEENAVASEQEIERWIDSLSDKTLREIARLKWAGFGDWDIANRLNRAPRTVERKVALLRKMWRQQSGRSPYQHDAQASG